MLGWVVHGGLVALHKEAAGALWVLICWRTCLDYVKMVAGARLVVHGGLAVTLHKEAAGALWVLICWRTYLDYVRYSVCSG